MSTPQTVSLDEMIAVAEWAQDDWRYFAGSSAHEDSDRTLWIKRADVMRSILATLESLRDIAK